MMATAEGWSRVFRMISSWIIIVPLPASSSSLVQPGSGVCKQINLHVRSRLQLSVVLALQEAVDRVDRLTDNRQGRTLPDSASPSQLLLSLAKCHACQRAVVCKYTKILNILTKHALCILLYSAGATNVYLGHSARHCLQTVTNHIHLCLCQSFC